MATKLAFLGESQFTQKHRRVASESCKAIHCLFAVPNKRTNSFWKNSRTNRQYLMKMSWPTVLMSLGRVFLLLVVSRAAERIGGAQVKYKK